MQHFHRLVALALTAIIALGAFSGCNTWRGMGKDVEKTGESIQKSSN